jgi:hypothetical protein
MLDWKQFCVDQCWTGSSFASIDAGLEAAFVSINAGLETVLR